MNNRTERILFILGNPDDKRSLEQEARNPQYPYSLSIVTSVKEAQKLLKERQFKAVLSDFCLSDGKITDLRPHLDNSSLIILTDPENIDAALSAMKSFADDYLVRDSDLNYLKLLPIAIVRSIELKKQREELDNYRTRLESLVRERTTELTDMYLHLQESEANFRYIFDHTSDGLVITDFDFNFIEANATLLNRFGVTKEFLSSRALIDFLSPAYHGVIFERLQSLNKGLSTQDMEIEIIAPLTRQTIPYEFNTVPIMFNHQNAILTIMRDITERKFLARKLFETIILTEEEERSRIARDLHDETGPLLSALKMYTTSFMESKDTEKKDKLASQMGVIIRDVIDSIKEISNDMSPHVLVNFGLNAALQNIVNLFSKNLKIYQQSNIRNLRFPGTLESVVYRIIKELINNTVKHAQAANIYIRLGYADAELSCHYRDDGIGFEMKDPQQMPGQGMGFSNIISRIRSLGGSYTISASPGNGFEINIILRTSPLG
jgi:PAS domain S-box-containing protein